MKRKSRFPWRLASLLLWLAYIFHDRAEEEPRSRRSVQHGEWIFTLILAVAAWLLGWAIYHQ